MTLRIIVGTQWGDEGKGRIVDWYAAHANVTARYNGGDNAGHTVTVGNKIFKLHLVPSGIIHPQVTAVLGNGMVINPARLIEEMDMLAADGVDISPERLRISHAAHLITPAHQALDRAEETKRGRDSIGTTGRGIGPAYTDKAIRSGLRMADLYAADMAERLGDMISQTNQKLTSMGAPALELLPILDSFHQYALRLKPHLANTSIELNDALRAGKSILAEGAQGTLLDIDHGTYPYVTSSCTTAAGALTGLGLGLDAARHAHVTGVVKAFQTRVGSGPFPTEVSGELALRLRGSGENPWDEYGTTTGRSRRVGWLDGILLHHASRLNGLTDLAVTKLDILSGVENLRICTAYQREGKICHDLPLGPTDLDQYEPVYEQVTGWSEDVSRVRKWEDLPGAARVYLERIEELAGAPVKLVSVGPERSQIVEKN